MKLPRFSESYLLEKEPAPQSSPTLFRPSRKLSPGGQIQLGSRQLSQSPESLNRNRPATQQRALFLTRFVFTSYSVVASWSILQYICSKVVDRLDYSL